MADRRTHRIAVELAREVGFDSARIESGGKHARVVVRLGEQERFHVLGHRAERHNLRKLQGDLRKMKQEMEGTT